MKKSIVPMAVLSLFWLTAGVADNPAAFSPARSGGGQTLPQKLSVPERGFISSEPAETWEQGLLSGNGTIGASVFSTGTDSSTPIRAASRAWKARHGSSPATAR